MAKAARILAALKRDGWTETRRSGSHRVLAKGDQQRIWATMMAWIWADRLWPGSRVTTGTPLMNCGNCRMTLW
jgi:HicA toxin of bacterial toxin-antitoxin,